MKSTIEWFAADRKQPKCDMKEDSLGTPVLIWPPHVEGDGYSVMPMAFFGRRVTARPSFYVYGRTISPQLWAYIPEPPTSNR